MNYTKNMRGCLKLEMKEKKDRNKIRNAMCYVNQKKKDQKSKQRKENTHTQNKERTFPFVNFCSNRKLDCCPLSTHCKLARFNQQS